MRKSLFTGIFIGVFLGFLTVSCGGGGGAPPRQGPPAPQNVQATAGDGQVVISWNPVTGATSYNLYMASQSGVNKSNYGSLPDGMKHPGITGTTFTHTGLTNGKTYYFVVTALNAGGESGESSEVFGTPMAPPQRPANVQATAGYQSAVIFWDASPGATSFNLYWGVQPGVTKQNGTKIPAITGTTFSHTGLTNGTTYYYVVTAENAAGGESGESSEVFATPSETLTQVPGPPGAPANSYVPDIEFRDPPQEDIVAPSGIPISIRDLIVIFTETATVGQVNALIQSLPAVIVGGNPMGKTLLLRLTGASDLQRVLDAVASLLTNPLVRAASINHGVAPDALPPHNVDTTNNRWTWENPPNLATGNWGLKAIRAPQAWNLFDFSVRKNAAIAALVTEVDETDGANVADSAHPDLSPRVNVFAGPTPSNHATMVAGFISATWDNNRGVEGVYPRNLTIVSRGATFWGTLQDTITIVLRAWPDVRVINYSAGVSASYADNNIDPVNDLVNPNAPVQNDPALPNYNPTWRVQMDNDGNTFLTAMQDYVKGAGGRENWLMFCSAGNLRLRPGTNQDYEARDNSECANVAVRGVAGAGAGADHFLTVEAMDSAGNRSDFSASAGTISAPGTCVRSTEYNDGANYDAACPGNDADVQEYATNSGTSFATPHATGLAAYLWSLDPNLGYDQVRQALTDPRNTVPVGGGGSPRIDAFSAAIGIDVIRGNGNKDLQRALVDVDDGTLDGNQRAIRTNDGTITADFIGVPTPAGDNRRGDGRISMADLRYLRDALTQSLVESGSIPPGNASLDGSATHFKKDLNFDGCVGSYLVNPEYPPGTVPTPPNQAPCATAPPEGVYPRADFNGDGLVSPTATLKFKGNDWTDLDVLKDLWPNGQDDLTEGWMADELNSLLPQAGGAGGSADIEFRSGIPLGPTAELDEIWITMDMNQRPVTRKLTATANRLVWTLPLGSTGNPITVAGYKNSNFVRNLCTSIGTQVPAMKHAEDKVATVYDCGGPEFQLVNGRLYSGADVNSGWAGSVTYQDEWLLKDPKTCPPLAILDQCTYTRALPGPYVSGNVTITISRVAEWEWIVDGTANWTPTIPPLLPPPPEHTCGDPFTICYSFANIEFNVEGLIPIWYPANHRIEVECQGNGDVRDTPPNKSGTKSYSEFHVYLWRSPGAFPMPGCNTPDLENLAPPGWTLTGPYQSDVFGPFDDSTMGFSFHGWAEAEHQVSPNPADNWSYANAITLTLTRLRIRIVDVP